MKRLLIPLLLAAAFPALAATARADVIAGPALAVFYGIRLLPWLLVGALVGVTAFLLHKFRKKK